MNDIQCLTCGGSGIELDTKSVWNEITEWQCVDCNGSGRIDREPQPSDGPDYHEDYAAWKRRQ